VFDRVDDVDEVLQGIERAIDVVETPDRLVAMQDLLQDLGIGTQRLIRRDGLLQEPPSALFVGMRTADEVHRDVRVDQDHSR
jgi:hypothetical protein